MKKKTNNNDMKARDKNKTCITFIICNIDAEKKRKIFEISSSFFIVVCYILNIQNSFIWMKKAWI